MILTTDKEIKQDSQTLRVSHYAATCWGYPKPKNQRFFKRQKTRSKAYVNVIIKIAF